MTLITGYRKDKVADYLRKERPKKVCLIFWHGLGDLVMFMTSFFKLRQMFPDITIDMAVQRGVGQEALMKEVILIDNPSRPMDGYDYTFQVHYHMSEYMDGKWTKNEWCCLRELGIEPISSYPHFKQLKRVKKFNGKHMVAIHYQATALPDACNPSEEVAHKIWKEVKEVGFLPVEAFFKHAWYNPVNEKFAFIPENRTVRDIPASILKLVKILQLSFASICVASGNLPMSLSIMPEKTLYLQKDFKIESYTKGKIAMVDVNNYQNGSVKSWLKGLKESYEQHN